MTTVAYWAPVFNESELYFCIVLRNLWHWCVPVLVMISGVLFLNPERNITIPKIFSKYIFKMVLALVLLGIPAEIALQVTAERYQFNLQQVKTSIINIAQGKTQTHLWFLYLIIGLYLITPLLRTFTRYTTRKEYGYFLVLLFIFTSVIATVKKFLNIDSGINIPINSVYVLYFLLGFYFHHYNISISLKVSLMIVFCFIIFTALGVFSNNNINPSMDYMLKTSDKDSPIIVITAIAVFFTIRTIGINFHYFDNLAPFCFGIFLVHPFFIYALYLFLDWTPINYPLPLFLLVTILVTFGLSLLTSFCVKKIVQNFLPSRLY